MQIASVKPIEPAESAAPTQKSTPKPKAQAESGTDTVKLSSAAQAALAAQLELAETQVQTAKEARGGDPQAQRLLAEQAAAKK
jgi:hypothetical protein